MTFNKTAATIAVATGSGIAGGVGIQMAVYATSNKTIEQTLKKFKFELIKDKNSTKGDELVKLHATGTKKEQLQKFCKENLETIFSAETINSYIEAVKKCTTSITFEKRAHDQLRIEKMSDNKYARIERIVDLGIDEAKTIVGASDEEAKKVDSFQNKIKSYCQEFSSLRGNTDNFEKKGSNYLKICSKAPNTNKDYGGGREVIDSK